MHCVVVFPQHEIISQYGCHWCVPAKGGFGIPAIVDGERHGRCGECFGGATGREKGIGGHPAIRKLSESVRLKCSLVICTLYSSSESSMDVSIPLTRCWSHEPLPWIVRGLSIYPSAAVPRHRIPRSTVSLNF